MSSVHDDDVDGAQPQLAHLQLASPTAAAAASASASSGGGGGSLALRVHALRSSFVAQRDHALQCDPLLVLAVDERPMIKTSVRSNSTLCTWLLSDPSSLQAVAGGAALPPSSAEWPTLLVALDRVGSARLQVAQEDFSARKGDDDLGSCAIAVEQLVQRAWRRDDAKQTPPAPADGSVTARALLTARGASSARANASSGAVAPAASASAVSSAAGLPPLSASLPPAADGWWPLVVESPLRDRAAGRHLGDVSIALSVQLQPYLEHLLHTRQNLRLVADLMAAFVAQPSAASPLRPVLLSRPLLKQLLQLVVAAAADKGSMEGERMRGMMYKLISTAIDVVKPEGRILESLFAEDSELWQLLFDLRRSVPLSSLSSAAAWATYEGLLESFFSLIERVADLVEPPPPPPVKSEEELAAEAAAAAAAAKRAEKKRRAALAAGLDPDEESASASSSKKKKGALSSSLPDPPVYPPSSLSFGLRSLDLLAELFDAFRVRLTGFKRSGDVDWSAESKIAELVRCCELLTRTLTVLSRWGSWSAIRPATADADADAAGSESASAAASSAGVGARMQLEELRPMFMRDTGDANAMWLQKQISVGVKKAKDTLADDRQLASRLQQQADRFLANFPLEPPPKKEKKAK